MPLPGCPSEQEWLAFHFGELAVDLLDSYREHLESCQRCDSAVQHFDKLTDPVIAALRGPVATPSHIPLPILGGDTRPTHGWPLPAEFDGTQPGNIMRAVMGEEIGTLVGERDA